jgi:phosphoribosylformylglycinamidine synthase
VIARVFITPKKGVLDPQGRAISSSLHSLGFTEVSDVRMGKYLEIRLEPSNPQGGQGGQGSNDGRDAEDAAARVRAMCERLLANGVIEDFRFEIDRGGAGHDA